MQLNTVKGLNSFWKALDDYSMIGDTFNRWSDRRPHQLVETDDDHSTLFLSVPGYTKNDLSIEMHDGQLVVTGELPEERVQTDLVTAKIQLRFSVSKQFVVENAALENGILAINLSRYTKSESVKIPIK